ncbi:MAG: CotH kinase family protein [Candidatus Cloacimonetes bacterium]|nr:CotH kinase family protein [Candidatus Cloacimonadota bacterium]MCF7814613.1 CotH kinase family protein [Candidatus Cloacimonadota bacterium]MCF7868111.1 CotH kinase family protein [Candidatus Cloacimonadota bacterium]MCF7883577.1 CotH kinase family protein [Candidatus Cloacimonadota bacterium]
MQRNIETKKRNRHSEVSYEGCSYEESLSSIKIKFMISIVLFFCILGSVFSQNIKINEIMSSNSTTIYDEDGDASDWIEIYNAETSEVFLDGFTLSDDVNDPYKWEFPNVSIPAQDFLLVFASGKDRPVSHWETIIDWGDNWKYFIGTEEPPSEWRDVDFDDSTWSEGPSGFGFGDDDDATILPEPLVSFYIRHTFQINDLANIVNALLHVDFDDAFVVYLNGVEIAREGIGVEGLVPAFDETAGISHEAQIYQGGMPELFVIENLDAILMEGNNILSIQTHNASSTSSDMSMIPFLTLGMREEPTGATGIAVLLENDLPKMHTNFKLSTDGEDVILSDNIGNILDNIAFSSLETDISFGRQPDGSDDFYLFNGPTPDSSNTTTGFLEYSADPIFDIDGGFYYDDFTFGFVDIPAGETIFYTLDGSIPDENSFEYTQPETIDSTVVIRARGFETGKIPSQTVTESFFVNIDPSLPVISLVSDPVNFFDENYGIYVMGLNASTIYPYYGANFWEDWERPINIQMFETDGTNAFHINAGVKIFGNYSRGLPQKSLAIYTRNQYDDNKIAYQIFPEKNIAEFDNIVLRNSGNDWEWSMMRDALMTSLVQETGLDIQDYRPSTVFINGDYWGIHNIREKINEHYLEANHGVDPDEIDMLEDNGLIIHGDKQHYLDLLDFIENNDISLPANYEYICTQMDMENYLNYMTAELFYANSDWPGRNLKFWREQNDEGKWRWILFDTDFGFGLGEAFDFNMLEFALEPNGPIYPNPPWSTFLFRRLVTNDTFVQDFVNLFADRFNGIFHTDHIQNKILELSGNIETEMPNHVDRWNLSMASWQNEVLVLQYFAGDRPQYVKQHIMDEFGLPGTANIYLDISPPETGNILVNTLQVEEFPWAGEYFLQNPVTLTGLDVPGWQFAGWSGDVISDSTSITLDMNDEFSLIAWFEPAASFVDSIVFNEINYNSAPDFDTEDWVEIYNRSQQDIDMSGWSFSDSDDNHIFEFPEGYTLYSDEFLVICRDTTAFSSFFPNINNILGNMDFGLSSDGEMVRLFDHTGELIDSLQYGVNSPWPTEPNGSGPTLALLNPTYDNTDPQSWAASYEHGTPGEINDVYVYSDENIVMQTELKLLQNFPNPFNPTTQISYSLPEDNNIKLTIYNIKGQLVKILVDEFQPEGRYTVSWNGKDEFGKQSASGIYFYKLADGRNSKTRKMILLK